MRKIVLLFIFLISFVSFVYAEGEYSTTAVINSLDKGMVNDRLFFNASNSGFSSGSGMNNCTWDFGDGNKTFIKVTSTKSCELYHAYTKIGPYEVNLTITGLYLESNSTSKKIIISSLEEDVKNLLDKTSTIVDNLKLEMSNLTIDSEIARVLNLESSLRNVSLKLNGSKKHYDDVLLKVPDKQKRKTELEAIKTTILALQAQIPLKLNSNSLKFSSGLSLPDEIPDEIVSSGEDINSYKAELFKFQQESIFKADASTYLINITYLDGSENTFVFVKKVISISRSGTGSVVEYIPKEVIQSISAENILTPGYSVVSADPVIKWQLKPSMIIEYKLDLNNLDSIHLTKTFALPIDLKGTSTTYEDSSCGDGVCVEGIEDEIWCPEDCKVKKPWLLTIFLVFIVILGIFYINFYKGKYNFKEVANLISVKLGMKRLFTSKQDLENLNNYIKQSFEKGNGEATIRYNLIKKGWTKGQIDYAFSKVKKR